MSQRRFPVVCARSRLQKRVTVIVTSVTLMSACVVAPPETAWGSGAATSCLAGQRAVAAEICIAKDPHAAKIVDAVRQLQQQYSLQSVVFGVWRDGKELVSGATGTAYPGV